MEPTLDAEKPGGKISMSKISRTLVTLAIGIPLMAAAYLVGGMIDTRAYRSYASEHGVDCSQLGWNACLTELRSIYLESLKHSALFPSFNWHQILPGIICIVVLISIFQDWNRN